MTTETSNLPALEDRDRFLACLSATLASVYDYDEDELPEIIKPEEEEENGDDIAKSLRALKKSGSGIIDSFGKKKDEERRKRIERHRKRRYTLACSMLESAVEFLALKESGITAETYRYLLQPLLTPPRAEKKEKEAQRARTSSKGGLLDNSEDEHSSLVESVLSHEPTAVNVEINQLLSSHDTLRRNVEEMTPGAGFQCLLLFLFQYLLSSEQGYDSRVRYPIKRLGVTFFVHNDIPNGSNNNLNYGDRLTNATRKFESMEQFIAKRILDIAKNSKNKEQRMSGASGEGDSKQITKQQIIRGLKIGTAGVVAGTLLAVTGGLAAPGIAAGLGALGLASVGTAFLALATSTAVISLFGVAGGGLAMYKMNRRTAGLTEFAFHQVTRLENEHNAEEREPELSRTVCISGWLHDAYDFHRPWGVSQFDRLFFPKLELLERFYKVYNPELVPYARKILERYDGEEEELWTLLNEKYPADPDHLFPLTSEIEGILSSKEEEILDKMIVEVAALHDEREKVREERKPNKAFAKFSAGGAKLGKGLAKNSKKLGLPWAKKQPQKEPESKYQKVTVGDTESSKSNKSSSRLGRGKQRKQFSNLVSGISKKNSESSENLPFPESADDFEKVPAQSKDENDANTSKSKHLGTVWDYRANYGGELYTVKWESKVLLNLCNSVAELALDFASMAGKQVLSQTLASALIFAAIIPTAVFNVMNNIDSTWTLIIERSDAAGKELARSLLSNSAGRRPVTLVGYSFGARVIYSCLKALVHFQVEWEERQEEKTRKQKEGGFAGTSKSKKPGSSASASKPENDNSDDEFDSDDAFDFDCEPACVVEDVVLMGNPNHLNLETWKQCRQVVAGRLVNVYSRRDKMLSYMFQLKRLTGGLKPVCGTCTVAVPGVENIDVTDIVTAHGEYCYVTGEILKRIRHGQPLRLSESNAIDEEAFIAEVEQMVEENHDASYVS